MHPHALHLSQSRSRFTCVHCRHADAVCDDAPYSTLIKATYPFNTHSVSCDTVLTWLSCCLCDMVMCLDHIHAHNPNHLKAAPTGPHQLVTPEQLHQNSPCALWRAWVAVLLLHPLLLLPQKQLLLQEHLPRCCWPWQALNHASFTSTSIDQYSACCAGSEQNGKFVPL